MEILSLDKISGQRLVCRGDLPFGLSGQAGSSPTRIGVRFKQAHMAYGLRQLERPETRERELPPVSVALLPVKGRYPFCFSQGEPAERQPQLRPSVALVLDKGQVLAVRDQP